MSETDYHCTFPCLTEGFGGGIETSDIICSEVFVFVEPDRANAVKRLHEATVASIVLLT